jgi:hypothetical protein
MGDIWPHRFLPHLCGLFFCADGFGAKIVLAATNRRLVSHRPPERNAIMLDVLLIVATPALIVSIAAYYITQSVIRHRERMAGLAPDDEAESNTAAPPREVPRRS